MTVQPLPSYPPSFEYWTHKKRQGDAVDGSVIEVMNEDFFGNTPETNTILKHTTPTSYVPFVITKYQIPVESLAEYTLSVYSKASSALTSSQFIVEAYDSGGVELSGGNMEGIPHSPYGGYYYAHYPINTVWERHSTTFTTGSNVKYLKVGFSSGDDLTSQYLENARLVKISPPTNWFNQENADEIACDGDWSAGQPCANTYDGDWDTFGIVDTILGFGTTAQVYFNYTKPPGALNSSKYEYKFGGTSQLRLNQTVNISCWSQDPLQFKFEGFVTSLSKQTGNLTCWDGGWNQIRYLSTSDDPAGGWFYEEAMWWDIE